MSSRSFVSNFVIKYDDSYVNKTLKPSLGLIMKTFCFIQQKKTGDSRMILSPTPYLG